MLNELSKDDRLCVFYKEWIAVYKEGAVRQVTLNKYMLALSWLEKLAPELKLSGLNRITYQSLLNQYAKDHERQTTMDFHHLLKGAILDAVDEGIVPRDPTRKAIVKGKAPGPKKCRYLNQFELHKLLASLNLGQDIGWEWFISKSGVDLTVVDAWNPAFPDIIIGGKALATHERRELPQLTLSPRVGEAGKAELGYLLHSAPPSVRVD